MIKEFDYYCNMKIKIFYLTLITILFSCNQNGVSNSTTSKNGMIDKIIGTYSNGGVTRIYNADSTVDTQSPFGDYTYSWRVLDGNPNFIKIEETQGDVKSIFYLYENSMKYPQKISDCIKNSGAKVMKNYTGAILIGQYALDSADNCNGLYFKGDIE